MIAHALLLFSLLFLTGAAVQAASPYPPSPVISGVQWDFTTLRTEAGGSDLWPTTWAADGNLYSPWGDGGGFGGDNTAGRVTIGVARITGGPTDWVGENVFGGVNPEAPATFDGKANSILSVGTSLYMFVTEQGVWRRAKIGRSDDYGRTWIFNGGTFAASDWDFAEPDGSFSAPVFIQFGQDYAGALDDGFVYLYSERTRPPEGANTQLILGRVPRGRVQERAAYEFFTGTDAKGIPQWSADIAAAQPVFEDPAGVSWGYAAVYSPYLNRYLLTVRPWDANNGRVGAWGIFDAPRPWGPWTTVEYYTDWDAGTPLDGAGEQILFHFPSKWLDPNGQDFTMVMSVKDSFNTLQGRFLLTPTAKEYMAPAAPSPSP